MRRPLKWAACALLAIGTGPAGQAENVRDTERAWEAVYQRIRNGESEVLKETVGTIRETPGRFPPIILAAVGSRLIQLDYGEAGLKWFYAGWLGTKTDIRELTQTTGTTAATAKTEEALGWLQAITENYVAGLPPEDRRGSAEWAEAYTKNTERTYPTEWMNTLIGKYPGPVNSWRRMPSDRLVAQFARELKQRETGGAGSEEEKEEQAYRLAQPAEVPMPYRLFPAEWRRGDLRKAEQKRKESGEPIPLPKRIEALPEPEEKKEPEADGSVGEETENPASTGTGPVWEELASMGEGPDTIRRLAMLGILAGCGLFIGRAVAKRWHLMTPLHGAIEYEALIRLNDGMSRNRRDDAQEAMDLSAKQTLEYHGARVVAAITAAYSALEGNYGDYVNLGMVHARDYRRIRIGMHPISIEGPLQKCEFGRIPRKHAGRFLEAIKKASLPPPNEALRFGEIIYERRMEIRKGKIGMARQET